MKIGIAGSPPQASYTNWDVWYGWTIDDLGRKKTAPLHKLKRWRNTGFTEDIGLHACWDAVDYIVTSMVSDTVGQRMGWRVLQLLNEPLNANESDWADAPRGAATWCARVILSVRARCPWVRFAGPNVCPWDRKVAEPWLWEFFDELDKRRAPLDIYAVHGYPLLANEREFLAHLEAVIDWSEPLALVRDYPTWITEIGDLWGSDVNQVRKWIARIEGFLERNADRYGINACLWFVSRDSYWHGLSPNTEVYDGDWKLTQTGEAWWHVWNRLGKGA